MTRYIDADDFNNNFRGELCENIDCENCSFHTPSYYCKLANYLNNYETSDVKPVVHAHIICDHAQGGSRRHLCSNCEGALELWDAYCRHCGAKMDEVGTS